MADGALGGSQAFDGQIDTSNIFADFSVTPDGRLLLTWFDAAPGEVTASVWDPRGDTIDMDDFNRGEPHLVDSNTLFSRAAGTTITGTNETDTINAGDNADLIDSLRGNDVVFAGGGNDTILANFGSDSFFGGSGFDISDIANSWVSTFSFGIDLVAGNSTFGSIERVLGGAGRDTLTGNDTATTLEGGLGADAMYGGSGTQDVLDYRDLSVGISVIQNQVTVDGLAQVQTGFEVFRGTEQADNFGLQSSPETFFGNGGADIITVRAGNNVSFGGTGDDTFFALALDAAASIKLMDGGADQDSLRTFGGPGTWQLRDDTIVGIEELRLLEEGTIELTAAQLAGNFQTISADRNTADAVLIDIEMGDEVELDLSTIAISDFDVPGAGFEVTDDGDDETITGTDLTDTLRGEGGNDTLITQQGDDVLYGGDGNDFFDVDLGFSNTDMVFGGDGNDTILADLLDGDEYFGGLGGDSIIGEAGNDTLLGGGDNDTIAGGLHDDLIDGGPGTDSLYGGEGEDTMTGGAGDDTFFFIDDGVDVITDFEITASGTGAIDRLFFTGGGLSFDELSFSEVSGDAVISYGTGSSVTFEGVDLATLLLDPANAPDWLLVFG